MAYVSLNKYPSIFRNGDNLVVVSSGADVPYIVELVLYSKAGNVLAKTSRKLDPGAHLTAFHLNLNTTYSGQGTLIAKLIIDGRVVDQAMVDVGVNATTPPSRPSVDIQIDKTTVTVGEPIKVRVTAKNYTGWMTVDIRIDGETKWFKRVPAPTAEAIIYPNLPPGKHTVEVLVELGNVYYTKKTFYITITKPQPVLPGSFTIYTKPSVSAGGQLPVVIKFDNPNSAEALFKATVTFAGVTKEVGIEVPANSTKTVTKEFTAPAKPGTYTVTASAIMYVLDKVFDLGKKTIEVEVTAPPKVSFSVSAPGEVRTGETFYVTVSITTNVKGSVKVEGKVGTKVAGWSGSVNPGTTDVRLPFTLDAPGTYTGYVTVYFNGNKVGTRAFTVKATEKEEIKVPEAKPSWWPLAVAGGVVAGLALLLRRRRPWGRFSRRRY